MTTDNKTLADVQPGGRVRLGDQRSDLVPGIVRCAKCAFQLHRTNLYVQSGTVGAGDSKTEPCPNGCGPLWPVTWETWAREGWAEAERLHLENAALSAQPSPGDSHHAVVPDMLVNGGALKMALNVLRRAGKNEVADELESTATIQPSPGGQGEAREIIEEFIQCATIGRPNGKLIAQAKDYLAARQPVGEAVAWMTHHDEPMLFPTAAEAAAYCEDDEKPVPLFRSTAQAVDLGQMPHGIRLVEIPRRNGLDPINVFVQDFELGRGRIVVTCYGQAWCGFWGAMGDRTVMQFVAECDADYVAGNMLSGRHEHVKKHERSYVERIATEVIAEFRALADSQAVGNG